MPDFSSFEDLIGVHFINPLLLQTAFTHRSYINENSGITSGHNERLEFLGDAVLELVITRYLFDKYPEKPEGELTAYRSSLVNTTSLAESAEKLGMNEYLLLSKGEARDTGKARHYILADAFEAVIGAIYLDQGYDGATQFIADNLYKKIDLIAGPVYPFPAFKHGERETDPLKMYLSDVLTVPANLTGHPGISVPIEFINGFPTGFQIIAPHFSESRMFKVGSDIEQELQMYKVKPKLW